MLSDHKASMGAFETACERSLLEAMMFARFWHGEQSPLHDQAKFEALAARHHDVACTFLVLYQDRLLKARLTPSFFLDCAITEVSTRETRSAEARANAVALD